MIGLKMTQDRVLLLLLVSLETKFEFVITISKSPRRPVSMCRPHCSPVLTSDRVTLGALLPPAPPTSFSDARGIRPTSQKLQPPSLRAPLYPVAYQARVRYTAPD